MKKKEALFIGGILVLSLILWLGINHFQKGHYGYITITVDGNKLGTYSLGKNQAISIGHTNICEIKDGQAHITEATCPDHLCMKQHAIDSKGGTIVCLPNKVVIEGTKASAGAQSDDSLSIDAVT